MGKITPKQIFLLLLLPVFASSQSFELYQEDTINRIDNTKKKQGLWVIFGRMKKNSDFDDDQKAEEGKYKNNKREGLWKFYYASGSLKGKIPYESGIQKGYAVIYHENGNVLEEGAWRNNRWVGEYKLYHENGKVSQEFRFNNTGKREGPQKYYYEDGSLMLEGNWKDGKENGTVVEYTEGGAIKAKKVFTGGEIDPHKTKIYELNKPSNENASSKPSTSVPVVVTKKETVRPNMSEKFDGEGYEILYRKQDKQISNKGYFHNYKLIDGETFVYDENGILTRILVYKKGIYVGDGVVGAK